MSDHAIGIGGLVIGVLGIIISIVSIYVAGVQRNDKKKLEQFSKSTLQGIAGNIAKIQQSSAWSANNLRDARNTAVELKDSELKAPLLKFLIDAYGDAIATDRLIINLFNEVLNMQEAQFNQRDIKHPEKKYLDLFNMETAKPETTPTTTSV